MRVKISFFLLLNLFSTPPPPFFEREMCVWPICFHGNSFEHRDDCFAMIINNLYACVPLFDQRVRKRAFEFSREINNKTIQHSNDDRENTQDVCVYMRCACECEYERMRMAVCVYS